MAFRHSCPNAGTSGSSRCRRNQPGKGPKKCPGCGAALELERGRYGVFPFSETNHYPESRCRGWRERPADARARADVLSAAPGPTHPRGFVVRFVADRPAPVAAPPAPLCPACRTALNNPRPGLKLCPSCSFQRRTDGTP